MQSAYQLLWQSVDQIGFKQRYLPAHSQYMLSYSLTPANYLNRSDKHSLKHSVPHLASDAGNARRSTPESEDTGKLRPEVLQSNPDRCTYC